jgi:hypothetical protein
MPFPQSIATEGGSLSLFMGASGWSLIANGMATEKITPH